jgi:hypothetical protein
MNRSITALISVIISLVAVGLILMWMLTPRPEKQPKILEEIYDIKLAPYEFPYHSSGWYIQIRAQIEPQYNPEDDSFIIYVHTGLYWTSKFDMDKDDWNLVEEDLNMGDAWSIGEMKKWIYYPNGDVFHEGRLSSWKDHEDATVDLWFKDGFKCLVHSMNTFMYSEPED